MYETSMDTVCGYIRVLHIKLTRLCSLQASIPFAMLAQLYIPSFPSNIFSSSVLAIKCKTSFIHKFIYPE